VISLIQPNCLGCLRVSPRTPRRNQILTWSGGEEKGDTKKWLDGCLDEPQQGQQSSLTILDMAPRKLVLALVVAAAIGCLISWSSPCWLGVYRDPFHQRLVISLVAS
jgi:hypothetical protein